MDILLVEWPHSFWCGRTSLLLRTNQSIDVQLKSCICRPCSRAAGDASYLLFGMHYLSIKERVWGYEVIKHKWSLNPFRPFHANRTALSQRHSHQRAVFDAAGIQHIYNIGWPTAQQLDVALSLGFPVVPGYLKQRVHQLEGVVITIADVAEEWKKR